MVVETIFASPLLLGALIGAIIIAVHYQRGLTYTEYRTAHLIKVYLFRAVESQAEKRLGARIINDKRFRDDEEFIRTIDRQPRAVFKKIRNEENAYPHLVASVKRRETPDGPQLTHSQLVRFSHDDGRQDEFYLFYNGDGTTDLYGHNEVSVFDPEAHLNHTDQRPVEEA